MGDSSKDDVDQGTVLRFVEPSSLGDTSGCCLLPGLEAVAAQFDENSQAAYCDHWVSNGVLRDCIAWLVCCVDYLAYQVFTLCSFSFRLVNSSQSNRFPQDVGGYARIQPKGKYTAFSLHRSIIIVFCLCIITHQT